jgi:hypothetical protein
MDPEALIDSITQAIMHSMYEKIRLGVTEVEEAPDTPGTHGGVPDVWGTPGTHGGVPDVWGIPGTPETPGTPGTPVTPGPPGGVTEAWTAGETAPPPGGGKATLVHPPQQNQGPGEDTDDHTDDRM